VTAGGAGSRDTARAAFVVSCEYASCALPAATLRRRVGWDPVALPVARGVQESALDPVR